MQYRTWMLVSGVLLLAVIGRPGHASEHAVNITHGIASVEVMHQGRKVVIERNPDTENMLDPDYSLTSRPCPPYCIQPISLGPGVETIGELEMLEYLKKVGKIGRAHV